VPVTSLELVAAANKEAKLWESIRAEASAPFDLEQGPLVRARLFGLRPKSMLLMLTTHHIIVDGFSQTSFQRDLWTIYEATSKGEAPALPPLPIQ